MKKTLYPLLFLLLIGLTEAVPVFSNPQAAPPPATDTMMTRYFKWVDMGAAALPEIKAAVSGDDWRIKTHALLAAGEIGDKSMIPIILDRLVHDTNRAVKNCAIKALGELKASAAVPELLGMLVPDDAARNKGPLPARKVIISALGNIGDTRATLPLCRLMLSNRNEETRNSIAGALIQINDPAAPAFFLAVKERKRDFPYVQATQIMSRIPAKGAEAFITPLLDNKTPIVRNAAADALSRAGTDNSIPALVSAFTTPDLFFRGKIGAALVAINSESAVPPLCDLLKNPDRRITMDAAEVLSQMTADNIAEDVFARFENDPGYNAGAAYVLGWKGYDPAIRILRDRLQNPGQTGRNEMAEALGRLNDRESIPLLISIAKQDAPDGQDGAVRALGDMKAKQAMPVLLSLLEQKNQRLMDAVIFAFGEIADPAATRPLIHLYYESGLKYQFQIGLALARIGGPDVSAFIRDNMDSGNRKRRRMAAFMLLKSSDKTMAPYAVSLLDDPDKTIRSCAIGALKNLTGQPYNTAAEWKAWASPDPSTQH